MYHYVRPIKKSKYKNLKALDFTEFKRQLDYLESNYNIISTKDVINCINKKSQLPSKACWLTFDDGYKDHIKYVLPELKKRNLHGAFFVSKVSTVEQKILIVNKIQLILSVCNDKKKLFNQVQSLCFKNGLSKKSFNKLYKIHGKASRGDSKQIIFIKRLLQHLLDPTKKLSIINELFKKYVKETEANISKNYYMNINDLKNLIKNKMYVGSHAETHRWLNRLSYKEQEVEIKKSLEFLKDIGISTKNWIMCYPHGGYNSDTLKLLKKNNCAIGLTANGGVARLTKKNSLILPRFDTNDFPK